MCPVAISASCSASVIGTTTAPSSSAIIISPGFTSTPPHEIGIFTALGKIEIVRLLIENNADIKLANKLQATPLDYAIGQSTKVTDLLRKHGGKTGEELKAESK